MCGERRAIPSQVPARSGSSPRVRGTLVFANEGGFRRRFIPACAGNARYGFDQASRSAVHPRVCGERSGNSRSRDRLAGSSPRVRGTPRHPADKPLVWRFIPACAGNAPSLLLKASQSAVHPRVCGERAAIREHGGSEIGSSPRVRGTRRLSHDSRLRNRFIPACAGNAPRFWIGCCTGPVHPRVCGERLLRLIAQNCIGGSSPRVRGTLVAPFMFNHDFRFIPACAGNAAIRAASEAFRSVHPRVCGERIDKVNAKNGEGGSSPRVRGTRTVQRAGDQGRTVHPRVCGERVKWWAATPFVAGSSPRVRGTRMLTLNTGGYGRFIPACAGNALLPSF